MLVLQGLLHASHVQLENILRTRPVLVSIVQPGNMLPLEVILVTIVLWEHTAWH